MTIIACNKGVKEGTAISAGPFYSCRHSGVGSCCPPKRGLNAVVINCLPKLPLI